MYIPLNFLKKLPVFISLKERTAFKKCYVPASFTTFGKTEPSVAQTKAVGLVPICLDDFAPGRALLVPNSPVISMSRKEMKSHFLLPLPVLLTQLLESKGRQTKWKESVKILESPGHRSISNKRRKRKKILMKTIVITFPTAFL